jgi:hypothetical protein
MSISDSEWGASATVVLLDAAALSRARELCLAGVD